MKEDVRGTRPRPRVALFGSFEDSYMEAFRRMFPTIYYGDSFDEMRRQVDSREIDLVVMGDEVDHAGDWPSNCHVICFSQLPRQMPGPFEKTFIVLSEPANTQEFVLPNVPLRTARRREADLSNIKGTRGWLTFVIEYIRNTYNSTPEKICKAAKDIFEKSALITERASGKPLAIQFVRPDQKLGFAWLPNLIFAKDKWVDLLLQEWSAIDPDSFPGYGDWQSSTDWMMPAELALIEKNDQVSERRQLLLGELDQELAHLDSDLVTIAKTVNDAERRLLTQQGDALVDQVALALTEIGFKVTRVDQVIEEGKPKKEDLRLEDSEHPDWIAIVEVRGYARSTGKISDFVRIARFAEMFVSELGRYPDQRFYVINGQLELPPSQRSKPFESSDEDVRIFAESGGTVLWTLDLFRALYKMCLPRDQIKASIINTKGKWSPGVSVA